VLNGPSRSSKVVDFGTNRKRVCNFLFVVNSNLGPILPRFRDIVGFLRRATPHLFYPNFRRVPFGLDCRCCGSWSEDSKLIIRVINFELVQPSLYAQDTSTSQTDRRTDRRTDALHNVHRAVKSLSLSTRSILLSILKPE